MQLLKVAHAYQLFGLARSGQPFDTAAPKHGNLGRRWSKIGKDPSAEAEATYHEPKQFTVKKKTGA